MKSIFKILISFLLLILNLPSCATELTILHTSDIHGAIFPIKYTTSEELGGISRRITLFNEYKNSNKNVLIFDTGDYYQGSVYNMLFKWKYQPNYMKYSKYDAVSFGNHEFDNGMKSLKKYMKKSRTEYISSNLKFNDSFFIRNVRPYKVFDVDDKKILVLAIITPNLKKLTSKANVEIVDTPQVIQQYIQNIPHDKVILLSHSGLEYDRKIAKSVNGIDVILGGHDHVYAQEKINNTLIIHTGEYGFKVNKIIINTNDNKISQSYILLDNKIVPNPTIDKELNIIQNKASKILSRKLAYSDIELDGRNESLHTKQTNLGKLILQAYANEFNNDFDIVFVNSGSIRINKIIKGDITEGDVYNMLPFQNKLVQGTLDGKTIKLILKKGSIPGRTYLQYYSKTKNIDDEKQYKVITLDYLYKGGDGYTEVKNLNIHKKSRKYIKNILIKYLISQKNIFK